MTEGKVKKDHQELQEVQARREAARSEKERGFTLLGVYRTRWTRWGERGNL